jgi:hypothetical protein
MKTLLSLFDYTGFWSAPFARNGWNVIQWDIKLLEEMDIMNLHSAEYILDELGWDIDGILAAAPCTDFAASGSRWWAEKDADGRTELSVELVRQVLRLVDLFRPTDPDYEGGFFWTIENPVGRIGKLTGLDDPIYFDPFEFAGYLNPTDRQLTDLDRIRHKRGVSVTQAENQFILDMNAYTKRTGLWGEFNRRLKRRPIAPVLGTPNGSPIHRLGGDSDRTKAIRSVTPAGFAQAFYEANCDYKIQECNQLTLF